MDPNWRGMIWDPLQFMAEPSAVTRPIPKFEDVADAIMYWYNTPETLRNEMGNAGREWCLENGLTAEQMGQKMIHMIDYLFTSNKQARPAYTLNKVIAPEFTNIGIVK